MENTSGHGIATVVPEEIKQWSWGAFLLNWIWGISNGTYIALLALIPYVGFIMAIVLGFKGNEWAWRNKRWESVEQFQRVQKKWTLWGVGLVGGLIGLSILAALAIPLLVRR
ncbi:MAG: ribonuclease G [Elusimicrobiota bacterium]